MRKKTGEWRIVIDYRGLNKAMDGDAYPIPLAWDNLQRAAGYLYYIALDMNWGFWNVPLEEESKPAKFSCLPRIGVRSSSMSSLSE